ncbi:hypothetical protein A5N17_14850 [Arthrobacter sp. D2]|nr:hypothetical protein [Arthrobacter sp. M5]NKR14742.1 hypothetical protein [Arthrobacter sp. M6]OEH60121.1 hypothetical protein A5N13_03815 [Arthrobacter sp. D4]OEH60735.1 hypothetical protein A5N17_14850 [Arthrobacter sp. D2]
MLGIVSPAVAASDAPVTPPGEDAIEEYSKNVGVDFLEKQKKLSEFKYWITQVPGIYDAGYVEQVNDAESLSVKALWKGLSPLRETVANEGRKRGIMVTFSERPYSVPEIDAAAEALIKNDKAFEPLGFKIASIGGVGDDAGEIAIADTPSRMKTACWRHLSGLLWRTWHATLPSCLSKSLMESSPVPPLA